MPRTSILLLSVIAACVPASTLKRTAPIPEASSPLAGAADSLLARYAMYGMSGSVLLEENGVTVLECLLEIDPDRKRTSLSRL